MASGAAREKARAIELETLLKAVPAIIFIARDRECHTITGSRATHQMLRVPPGENLSKSAPTGEQPTHFRVYKDGRELALHELPVQRAARGEEVRDEELELRFADGSRLWMLGDATPLHHEQGGLAVPWRRSSTSPGVGRSRPSCRFASVSRRRWPSSASLP